MTAENPAAEFAAAQKAWNEGRRKEAIEAALDVVEAAQEPSTLVLRSLSTWYLLSGYPAEAEHWARKGVERFPKDFDLWNVLGVSMRRQRKFEGAIQAFDQAAKINPKNAAPVQNKANAYNDMGDGTRALALYSKLVRQAPTNAEYHRGMGLALRTLGEIDKAESRLATATRLKPQHVDAWIDRVSIATGAQRHDEAIAIAQKALEANPGELRLTQALGASFRRAGRHPDAVAFFSAVIEKDPDAAWAHNQLGRTLADRDRPRANIHLKRAVELAPDETAYRYALAESLDRSRYGVEAEHIQEAYENLKEALRLAPVPSDQANLPHRVFHRVGDYEASGAVGTLANLGRAWARGGHHGSFLQLLPQVRTPEDRLELLHQHRMWGKAAEARAAENPIARKPLRKGARKIRLGFNSSDLRRHPVAYFALPLFQHIDRERFEVFCYSFALGAEDQLQRYITSQVDGFRWHTSISDRAAAQMMADDELDILFELGSSTHMNKLEAMAFKPAQLQVSWLGYPHSSGLSTIDYLLVDPYLNPERPELLIEKPLIMPKCWIALGSVFTAEPAVAPETPESKNGYVTFGTANNPYKYSPEMLRVWASIVAAVPNSRFLFVRPEGGVRAFRENMLRYFTEAGVSEDRVRFEAIRGKHLPFYNEMDISLDSFPQTGGTTTCESLWMGVPVVSLVGDALFERLSHSILNNAGFGDLSVRTLDEYKGKALELAAEEGRRRQMRATVREQMMASPLGQREQFARDFYDLVARTVQERLGFTPS